MSYDIVCYTIKKKKHNLGIASGVYAAVNYTALELSVQSFDEHEVCVNKLE